MKRIPTGSSFETNDASGDGWFSIFNSTYDESTSKWCTETMIANNGILSATVPADLADGNYLVRVELLALHAAVEGDPQFYVGCAQIDLQGGGTAEPTNTISIPDGYVDMSMAAMTYNVYEKPLALPYPMFGPAVYTAVPSPSYGSSAAVVDATTDTSSSTADSCLSNPVIKVVDATTDTSPSTPGSCPPNTVLEVANWCGIELSPWTDTSLAQPNCWNASSTCWRQGEECWENMTVVRESEGCKIWEKKCNDLDDYCNAGAMTSPPDLGEVLTPKRQSVDDILPSPQTRKRAADVAERFVMPGKIGRNRMRTFKA